MVRTKATPKKQDLLTTYANAAKSPAKYFKPHRYRPGTVALKKIRRYQGTTGLLIPKATFQRVVRDIAQHDKEASKFKWQSLAMLALQEAAEDYIIGLLKDAQLCAIHSNRETIQPHDIHLCLRVWGV